MDGCGPSTLSEEQGVTLDPFVREYCELLVRVEFPDGQVERAEHAVTQSDTTQVGQLKQLKQASHFAMPL